MGQVRRTDWVEEHFGKFGWKEEPARPGAIVILGEWARQNLVSLPAPLPIADSKGRPVKEIRCHRLIAVPLRRALEELATEKLTHLVNTFDGCFEPRHKSWDKQRALSRHSWGIAVDLNARLFPLGSRRKQDKQLIAAFARQGFAWGGDWRTPDPMHFEMADLHNLMRGLDILVNGERVATGFMDDGRVMGSVREIAEALGASVEPRLSDGIVQIQSDAEQWR
jgi:hypothetical protein